MITWKEIILIIMSLFGVKQSEIADKLNVEPSYITRIKRGERYPTHLAADIYPKIFDFSNPKSFAKENPQYYLQTLKKMIESDFPRIKEDLADCWEEDDYERFVKRLLSRTETVKPRSMKTGNDRVISENSRFVSTTMTVSLLRKRNNETILLSEGLTLIGRNRVKCKYCILDNSHISLIHAAISVNPDGVVAIQDLNSVNGTYLNQLRIPAMSEMPLQNNDLVSLADEAFIVHIRTSSLVNAKVKIQKEKEPL